MELPFYILSMNLSAQGLKVSGLILHLPFSPGLFHTTQSYSQGTVMSHGSEFHFFLFHFLLILCCTDIPYFVYPFIH